MKITNSIIVVLTILLPFLFYWQTQTEDARNFAKINTQYDGALTTAVQDAAISLKRNAKTTNEYQYTSKKYSNINKEESYKTFLKTLSNNFGVIEKNSIKTLEYYIPIFAVIEYDGLSNTRFERVNDSVLRVWLPKQPYTYTDASGNIFNFTLDDHVKIYDVVSNPLKSEWKEGKRAELMKDSAILLLQDEEKFDRIRRLTIVQQVETSLTNEINNHNQLMSTMGVTYRFAMPLITEEEWYNTVDDVGVVTFIQGYPIARLDRIYNQYAFAGSRLLQQTRIYATTLQDGARVFWESDCNFNYDKTEIYNSKADAAKAGYRERSCMP